MSVRGATLRRMNDINYAMDAWLGDLARAGRTPATRLKYQQVLWQFASFLERDGIRDCDRITPDHCRRFLDRWVNSSASTMALGVTVLRGFFAFLVDETVLEHSPAERIKRPRRKRPLPADRHDDKREVVAGEASLPSVLLAKLELLRVGGKA